MPQTNSSGVQSNTTIYRLFAWCNIAILFSFLLNNYLTNWRGLPGGLVDYSPLSLMQSAIYLLFIIGAFVYVLKTSEKTLRNDSSHLYSLTTYIIRAAFWSVFLVGLADAVISFLRVEGLLPGLVGDDMTIELGRPEFRAIFVHYPLLVLGFVIAFSHKGLGFPWLALLVVLAELLIVITRFVFSYEQAFMSDLVRFWYGALFLFASAHTLIEEGHVRVDILFAGLSEKTKGFVNAYGSLLLGIPLCWVILAYGMNNKTTVINNPLLRYEVTQTGFGMYVKYWMAGFLAVFAISMLIQFCGYFLEGIADKNGEPGKKKVKPEEAEAI